MFVPSTVLALLMLTFNSRNNPKADNSHLLQISEKNQGTEILKRQRQAAWLETTLEVGFEAWLLPQTECRPVLQACRGWGNHGRSLSALPHVPDVASPLSSPHLRQNPNSKETVTEDSSSAAPLET